MEYRLHEAENMDSFEKGWSLREAPIGKAGDLDAHSENKMKVKAAQGGFLPSIGGSASARSSSAQVRRYS